MTVPIPEFAWQAAADTEGGLAWWGRGRSVQAAWEVFEDHLATHAPELDGFPGTSTDLPDGGAQAVEVVSAALDTAYAALGLADGHIQPEEARARMAHAFLELGIPGMVSPPLVLDLLTGMAQHHFPQAADTRHHPEPAAPDTARHWPEGPAEPTAAHAPAVAPEYWQGQGPGNWQGQWQEQWQTGPHTLDPHGPYAYAPNGYGPNGYAPNGYGPYAYAPNGYAPYGYAPNGYAPYAYAPYGTEPASAPAPAAPAHTSLPHASDHARRLLAPAPPATTTRSHADAQPQARGVLSTDDFSPLQIAILRVIKGNRTNNLTDIGPMAGTTQPTVSSQLRLMADVVRLEGVLRGRQIVRLLRTEMERGSLAHLDFSGTPDDTATAGSRTKRQLPTDSAAPQPAKRLRVDNEPA
ncbi:hypothetical protein AB0N09_34495 [Streptomyces erythrochromogenes]|uniref:hypothetical protein n=1 Tax=Streptomyces erythrochromogenes TaxID=285574 RepID=UPI003441F2DE